MRAAFYTDTRHTHLITVHPLVLNVALLASLFDTTPLSVSRESFRPTTSVRGQGSH